ncbi:L-glutamate gamma-semialdehyde dehydrogenase [Paenibacillus antri]|uniref:L-glutamate gamma-semialdehyde dehydrogenase n=1 Tax=Paenibacillus antri TaxID=2582848 RepID=A0A5R9G5H7_9BACL|nr:L-glutamate gamma-semialdehyde dehydrogenase [Paenibacillus antri]TLS50299.1 L-glutamate gamma-semialdehyde dehydrogenase [Paenibacillus antri]
MIPYTPEPFTDFSNPKEAQGFEEALAKVRSELGLQVPLVIGGQRIATEQTSASINPSRYGETVGVVAKADRTHAEQAIQAAHYAYKVWSRVSPEARATVLFKTAAILRRRKHEFSAWLTVEAGKVRAEADADTAEAIDFMEYYGRQMIALAKKSDDLLVPMPGEHNRLEYIPLGVGIVIPPWNFPLAIMVGMTVASIVAGNTVVLKPASTTPVIAYKFYEMLEDAGLPPGVINFVPGSGAEIGDFLVTHKLTRFIAFTGSRDVGLRIHELSAKQSEGQIWLKRYIGEMGGKDSIVVDRDADLEAAAQAIVASAFGFSGQKCSACSRAIVHQDVYDEVLRRTVELTRPLKVGDAADHGNYTGPVVDRSAYEKILEYVEIGKGEGRLLTGGGTPEADRGYFIEPTIFADVEPNARLMQEEIFGPVLAFSKATDFDHALEIANNTEYGLTGSVFTRNRAHIERARQEFHVGNLYFNRKCTGAIVGVHPFGGFNLSGTDSKAGGPDYLLQFAQLKLSSERL